MLPRPLVLILALAAVVSPSSLYAQSSQPETDGVAPAHVSHVDGTVSLEREGRADHSPLNMPLLSGDRLRTVDGRVEVRFADGSTLHLDARSTLDVQSDDLVRLTEGRLRLNILGPRDAARSRSTGSVAYRIDSPAGSARITQPGEYRIALLRPSTPLRGGDASEIQLELAVVRGAAEVFTDQGATSVRAGERAYASAGLAPSYAYAYNSATWDGFDRWSEARRDVRLGVSSQHLPSDIQGYAPLLDESGDWRQTSSYGYAWYPRVSADWRPYHYGRWASYPQYGWTWIGSDRFAWPTHHYGRWGFSGGVWFWVPSSRWAPAYVSWAYAPGYVSWCPLGFDNQPIIGLDLYRVGPNYYSPWRAWTAVSYSHFGARGYSVHQRAVNWDRVDRGQRPRFATRPSAPGFSRDIAVPRNSTPIRWAGSRDLPPDGGRYGNPRGDGAPSRDGVSRGISRGTGAPSRDGSSRDDVRRPPSGGGDVAVPRAGATPRYVNRGDDIVRSPTERPTPRAAPPAGQPVDAAQGRPFDPAPGRPTREGYAVPRGAETRTVPDGPTRSARPEFERRPFDPAQGRSFDPVPGRPSPERPIAQPVDGAQGRPFDGAQGRPRRDEPRGGPSPSYQPYQPPAREAAPRAYEPLDEAQGRRPRPGYDPQPFDGAQGRPAPSRQPAPERAAPAPSRDEGRQPPPAPSRVERPERGQPAEGAAPAAPTEPAAPRAGVAVPRRGGRGGS